MTGQPPPPPPSGSDPPPPSWGEPQGGGYGTPAPGYGSSGPAPAPGPPPGGYPGQAAPPPGYPGYAGGPAYGQGTPPTSGGGGGSKAPLIIVGIVVLLLLIGGGVFLATRNTGTSVTTPTPTPTARPTPRPTPTPTRTPAATPTITQQYIDCSAGTPESVDQYGAAAFADLCAIQPPRDILLARLRAKDLPGIKESALALATAAQTSLTDLKSQTPTTASERSADVLLQQGLQDVVDGGTGVAAGIDATSSTAVQTSADKIDAGTNLILTQLPKLH